MIKRPRKTIKTSSLPGEGGMVDAEEIQVLLGDSRVDLHHQKNGSESSAYHQFVAVKKAALKYSRFNNVVFSLSLKKVRACLNSPKYIETQNGNF